MLMFLFVAVLGVVFIISLVFINKKIKKTGPSLGINIVEYGIGLDLSTKDTKGIIGEYIEALLFFKENQIGKRENTEESIAANNVAIAKKVAMAKKVAIANLLVPKTAVVKKVAAMKAKALKKAVSSRKKK